MADFCNVCATDLFGEAVEPEINVYEILVDLEPGYAMQVLCEGCGMSHVGKHEDGKPYLLFPHDDDIGAAYDIKEWKSGDLRKDW